MHQSQIPFFNQIKKIDAGPVVFFCDGNDEAEISFDEALFGDFVPLGGFFPKRFKVFLGNRRKGLNALKIQCDWIETVYHKFVCILVYLNF